MVRVFGRPDHERDRHDPQDEFSWNEVPPWAVLIVDKMDLNNRLLQRVLREQEYIMGTMRDVGDSIARNRDATDSILTMLQGVVQMLKDAQAQNDPAAIDDAIKSLDANTARLVAAATNQTPVDPNPGQPIPAPVPEPPSQQ